MIGLMASWTLLGVEGRNLLLLVACGKKMVSSSVLYALETISKVEEGGALILLFLLVSKTEGTFVVHPLAHKELELRESTGDKLDELGRAALE